MGLEGMSEIHASRSRRFNCFLPAFIRYRLLIRQDCGYFCGDVFTFNLLPKAVQEIHSLTKMSCTVQASE